MNTHNQQVGIRLPRKVYLQLKAEARLRGLSLSKYLRQIIDNRPRPVGKIKVDQSRALAERNA